MLQNCKNFTKVNVENFANLMENFTEIQCCKTAQMFTVKFMLQNYTNFTITFTEIKSCKAAQTLQ